jgi:hypothetical protein
MTLPFPSAFAVAGLLISLDGGNDIKRVLSSLDAAMAFPPGYKTSMISSLRGIKTSSLSALDGINFNARLVRQPNTERAGWGG